MVIMETMEVTRNFLEMASIVPLNGENSLKLKS